MILTKSALKMYLFSGKSFYKKLGVIALPIIIQNFISSFLNIVDTVMIGKLGEIQIAAVGVANQFFLLFFLVTMGIHSGAGILISQFYGKGDYQNIKRVLGVALQISVAVSIIFFTAAFFYPEKIIGIFNREAPVLMEGGTYIRAVALSYIFASISLGYSTGLRSIGKTFIPMVVSGIALGINTLLNYILIFGTDKIPPMGVKGAAIATVISRLGEMIILLVLVYGGTDILNVKPGNLKKIPKDFIKGIVFTMIPVVLNEGAWALGSVTRSIAYARMGSGAMASVQIMNTVQNLFHVFVYGVAGASAVMIGHLIGGNEEDGAHEYAMRFTYLSWIMGIVLCIAIFLTARVTLVFFNVSETVYASTLWMQYMTGVTMIFRVFVVILAIGVLRGGGDAKFAFYAESLTMWLIGVPMAFIGAFFLKLPIHWVVALSTLEEFIKVFIFINRLRSKKWVNNLVRDMPAIPL